MQMKHKRTKPAQTKEQQAAEEGWIYVYAPKTIRGWNSIWVEGGRGAPEADEERALRLYTPNPTGALLGSSERCSDSD